MGHLAPKFERLLGRTAARPRRDAAGGRGRVRAVDAAALSFRLDEHARVMFDAAAARDGGATSHRLAALLTDELRFRTDASSIEGLWLDRVLDRRAGHPLALAVLAAEIGRRAGLPGRRVLDADRLVPGIGERKRLWLIHPALDPGPTPSGPVRRHCGHEVAFAALTGVYARLVRDGEGAGACRAAQLRGRLPVGRHG